MRAFLTELRRRNVHRTTIAYLATGWLIIEVLQNLLPIFDAPDWLNQAIVLVLIAGLPLAIWLSWAFEFTGEGIKRSADVVPGDSIAERSGRIVDFVIIGILLAAVVLLLSDRFIGRSAPALVDATDVASIAVLPFDDFSEARDQRHLAIGITDTLLNALAQVEDLKVIARTSVIEYEGSRPSIAEIGEALGVGAVLEGSVQRQDDRLRITAQLIRVSDESHLWSRAFDMTMGDIFAIQDDIANAVATALRPGQMQDRRLDTGETSVEAYEHFVRGRDLWRERSKASIDRGVEELERAVELDPQYAPARAELALAYMFAHIYGGRAIDEVRLLVEREVERALELDPDLAVAWAAKAQLEQSSGNLEDAESHFRKAIALDPSESYYYQWLSQLLALDLPYRFEEWQSLKRRMYEIDPQNEFIIGNYALYLAYVGDKQNAIALAEKHNANLALVYRLFGQDDKAIRFLLPFIKTDPEASRFYLGISVHFLDIDDQEAAEAWFAEGRKRTNAFLPLEYEPYWFMRPQDIGRLKEKMKEAVIRSEGWPRAKVNLAFAQVLDEEYEEARAILDPLLKEIDIDGPLRRRYVKPLLLRAQVAKATGESEYVRQIVSRLEKFSELALKHGYSEKWFSMLLASTAALTGDRGRVIANLRRAVDNGFMNIRELKYEPIWDPYRDDSEFKAIVADIEARQREQRESLYADGIRFPPGHESG